MKNLMLFDIASMFLVFFTLNFTPLFGSLLGFFLLITFIVLCYFGVESYNKELEKAKEMRIGMRLDRKQLDSLKKFHKRYNRDFMYFNNSMMLLESSFAFNSNAEQMKRRADLAQRNIRQFDRIYESEFNRRMVSVAETNFGEFWKKIEAGE